VLSTAFIRVGYLAAEPDERVFDRFKSAFATIERQPEPIVPPVVSPAKATVSEIEDRMAVNQGKLVLGFRTSSHGDDRDTYRLMVLSDLFGGGPYSLLFDNVREKMSLCYYCASRTNRRKGFLTVDSGVEFANMDKTYDEILNQLNRLKNGDFEDSLLDASKKSLCESFRALGDSQSVIDRYYADRVHSANPPTPDEMGELVRSVTRDDIIHVANSLKLDTVYRLKATEEMKK
ncbi:MAG: insulinase family protein, partial [Clostridia bacterium]|nr:insulinase family protein [Clostridia bacterium]